MLSQLSGEVAACLRTLKEEASRLKANDSVALPDKVRLVVEKYSSLMKPVLMKLKTVYQHNVPFLQV